MELNKDLTSSDNETNNNAIARGYISKLVFNNGKELDINKNDIVVFVGPNNAGKSQALSDIYALSEKKYQTVVISDIEVIKKGSLKQMLDITSQKSDKGDHWTYSTMGRSVVYNNSSEERFLSIQNFSEFRNWFVIKLDTQTRLSICNPVQSIRRSDTKTNPIHYAAFDNKYRKWLSKSFKQAFGTDIIPNTLYGSYIPLCIGNPVKLDDVYEDEQERQEAYADILADLKQVQNQGDGIKSFTGILLYLMLNYYCVYLIDEPESFLHPPQAKIMGQIIGTALSNNQQAFLSTHSEDVINGLLEVCPDRLKIIRITRNNIINEFSILDNQNVKEVFGDPLLKYSNIMSSLFHKSVVLCESDSDCKLYSVIDSYLKKDVGYYSETLFLHCGGKHRMARTALSLKSLNIDVRIIPDMDLMDNENVFRNIIEVMGIDWNTIKSDYKILVSNLHSEKESIVRSDAKRTINLIFDSKQLNELSSNEICEIKNAVKVVSKWDAIKHAGEAAIPSGDATNAYKRIKQTLIEHNIYLVPVGQLEGFVKEIGNHGPSWVNDVLDRFPDLSASVYDKVKEFIKSIGI